MNIYLAIVLLAVPRYHAFVQAQVVVWEQSTGPIHGVATQFARIDEVLFAGNRNALFRSVDGGDSWSDITDKLPLLPWGDRLRMRNLLSWNSMLFVSGPAGIYRSGDQGDSWSNVGQIFSDDLNFNSTDLALAADRLLVASSAGLLASTDFGSSWLVLDKGLPADTPVDHLAVEAEGILFSNGSTVYHSSDSGTSWREVSADLVDSFIASLALFDGDYYVLFESPFLVPELLYRSTNEGNDWSPFNHGLGTFDVNDFRVSAATLYLTSDKGLWQAPASAAEWSQALPLLRERPVRAFDFTRPPLLLGTRPDAVLRSSAPGAEWTAANHGFVDSDVRLMTSAEGTLLAIPHGSAELFRSVDEGRTWLSILPNGPFDELSALHGVNPNLILLGGESALFRSSRTQDGIGLQWNRYATPFDGQRILGLGSARSTWIAMTESATFRTTDAAASWIDISDALPDVSFRYLAADDAALYIGSPQGPLLRSTDDGLTWESLPSNLPAAGLQTLYCHRGGLFAGYAGNNAQTRGLFRSTDGGTTWLAAFLETDPPAIYDVQAYRESVFAASNSGVFRSSDGGDSWRLANAALGSRSVRSLSADQTLFAGTQRRGVYRSVLPPTNVAEDSVLDVTMLELEEISAIPGSGSTQFSFSLRAGCLVRLYITDLRGRIVATLIDQMRGSGRHHLSWRNGHLPSGLYAWRLSAAGESAAGSVLVLR